jgi:hypothetical protein
MWWRWSGYFLHCSRCHFPRNRAKQIEWREAAGGWHCRSFWPSIHWTAWASLISDTVEDFHYFQL